MRGRLLSAGVAASFGLVFVPGLAGAASAATCGYPAFSCSKPQLTSDNVGSSTAPVPRRQEASAAVRPSSDTSAPIAGLPFTGAEVAQLSAIGVAALGAGTLLRRHGRHSQS